MMTAQFLQSYSILKNLDDLVALPKVNDGMRALDGIRVCSLVCDILSVPFALTRMINSSG